MFGDRVAVACARHQRAEDQQVERAVHLLKTTPASVDEIAQRVGYADGVTLRTLLRRRLGRGVREMRLEQ